MRYAALITAIALSPAWGQMVKPTPGALTPANTAAAAAAPAPAATTGSIGRTPNNRDLFRLLEDGFDARLKAADRDRPIFVIGSTRGLYVPGFGAVFTTEVDLVQNTILAAFHSITAEDKAITHDRKIKQLDVLRKQMTASMAEFAKRLEFMGPNDQVVLAVRMIYQGWEDRSGLPEQIVMKADRRGAQTGDVKVDIQ